MTANTASSGNDAHFVGDSSFEWFHEPFLPLSHALCPAYICISCFPRDRATLQAGPLSCPTVPQRTLLCCPLLRSPAPCPKWLFQGFSQTCFDTSQPFPLPLVLAASHCFYQMFCLWLCFASPTLTWGSANILHSAAAKYSKLIRSYENPDVNLWQHTRTWRPTLSFGPRAHGYNRKQLIGVIHYHFMPKAEDGLILLFGIVLLVYNSIPFAAWLPQNNRRAITQLLL